MSYIVSYKDLVKVGDRLQVKKEMFTRGGQCGNVVLVAMEGVALDFETNWEELPKAPSIEFWLWNELEMEHLEKSQDE